MPQKGSPHRFSFRSNRSASPTPCQGGSGFPFCLFDNAPQGLSDSLRSRWLAMTLKGGRARAFPAGRVCSARAGSDIYAWGAPGQGGPHICDPCAPGRTQKKGTARPLDSASPGEGGSPFFHLAIKIRLSYKESRGCPLFPFPARGLKLIARSGTFCSITREATNGQPPFCSPLLASCPGA